MLTGGDYTHNPFSGQLILAARPTDKYSFDVSEVPVHASTCSERIFTNIKSETTSPPRAVSL
jgi:hypothetical protein